MMTKYPIAIHKADELISSRAIRHVVQESEVNGTRITRIHTAWQLRIGKIMVYEFSTTCSPSSSLCFFDTFADYNEACEDLDWVSVVPLRTSLDLKLVARSALHT